MANGNSLPPWASYLIAGLSALIFFLCGVSGTLLVNDRQSITKTLEKFENIEMVQNKTIAEQTKILAKLCMLIPMDYETRSKYLNRNPINIPEELK
jgi:hypothetical protein